MSNLGDAELAIRGSAVIFLILHAVAVLVCVLKSKHIVALFGALVPFIAWGGALRLGRPRSWWARRFYGSARTERAETRAADFDGRWGPRRDRFLDLIGGLPSQPDPIAPSPTGSRPPTG